MRENSTLVYIKLFGKGDDIIAVAIFLFEML